MATRKAGIAAELSADNTKWKRSLTEARVEAMKFAESVKGMKADPFVSGTRGAADYSGALGLLASKAGMVAAGVAGMGAAFMTAARADGDFEGWIKTLGNVSDGTETVRYQVRELEKLAKSPGLGFSEMMAGTVQLQAAGVESKKTREFMQHLGNAIAANKGKVEDFAEAMINFRQIMSTGSMDGDDIKQIAARVPGFIGVAATLPKDDKHAWLAGVTKWLAEFPKAARTAESAVSDLNKEWSTFLRNASGGAAADVTKAGAGALSGVLKGDFGEAGKAVADSNVGKMAAGAGAAGWELMKMNPEGAKKEWDSMLGSLEDPLTKFEPSKAEIDRRKKLKEEAAKAEKAAGEAALKKENELVELRNDLAEAKAKENQEAIAAAAEQLAIAEKLDEMMKRYKMSQKDATEAIRLQTRIELQHAEALKTIAEIKKREEQQGKARQAMIGTAEDIAIQEARGRGRNKLADRMERNLAEKRMREQLMEQGVDPQQAAALAQRKAQADEDAASFAATGRRKTRGAVSENNPLKLWHGFGKEAGFSAPSALDTRNKPGGSGGPGNQRTPVETLLENIHRELVANRKTVAERTAPRAN